MCGAGGEGNMGRKVGMSVRGVGVGSGMKHRRRGCAVLGVKCV